jgi:flagellar biosynthesis/type III secretory pathway protein FliH
VNQAEAIQAAELAEAEGRYRLQLARESFAAGFAAGRQAHLSGGYQAGFDLGHDTGLSARQDTRAYVHGIMDGFAAGTQARQEFAARLLHRGQPAPHREPEMEAGS